MKTKTQTFDYIKEIWFRLISFFIVHLLFWPNHSKTILQDIADQIAFNFNFVQQ